MVGNLLEIKVNELCDQLHTDAYHLVGGSVAGLITLLALPNKV